jgi:hypothetical protein
VQDRPAFRHPCMPTMLTVERETLCTSTLWQWKGIQPARSRC